MTAEAWFTYRMTCDMADATNSRESHLRDHYLNPVDRNWFHQWEQVT